MTAKAMAFSPIVSTCINLKSLFLVHRDNVSFTSKKNSVPSPILELELDN